MNARSRRTDGYTERGLIKAACIAGISLLLCGVVACRQPAPKEAPPPLASVHVAGVAAANPMAVAAGIKVLDAGGSAADAAVAIQAMLGLVEPQSSGIGGGAFLMHYEAATGKLTAFNGRETAPAAASPSMFLGDDGQPLSYRDAVLSGRSTGVPGVMPMLGEAHAQFGVLPWPQLFEDAIRAAELGYKVPQRLAMFANSNFPQAQLPDARALFSGPDGQTVQEGDELKNPDYAKTLRQLASQGPRALHEAPIAEAIIARTRQEPRPGRLELSDFTAYRALAGDPVCGPFLVYRVCVPPPPSSGVSLLQLLAILDRTDIAQRGPADPQAWFLFAEASRLMYADRDQYIADPKFVEVPVQGLIDADYVTARARLIGQQAGPPPAAGQPETLNRGPDATVEPAGTSHFVVVDAQGNAVSMTTSVESLFGSGRAVGGFMLNNQLTDFSYVAEVDGVPVANAVAPGKRPRSSMSPVIVLDQKGQLVAALGSPGGSAILAYNAKALVGLLGWELPLQQAIDLPNVYARGENFYGERTKFSAEVLQGLEARGVTIEAGRGERSGLHGLIRTEPGRYVGAADPRREGIWRTAGPDSKY